MTQPRFFKLPCDLKGLSPGEKIVAAALMSHGRTSSPIYPSLETLSGETEFTVRGVWKAIRKLEKVGHFRTKRIGKRCTNRYFPSVALAALFGYSGPTMESTASNRNSVPVTQELSSSHSGTECQSIAKQTKVSRLDNSHGNSYRKVSISNSNADAMANEADTVEVTGTEFQSLARIGYSHFEANRPFSALLDWGVNPSVAEGLVARHPDERIRQQLCWLPFRSAENPSGLLVRAIEKPYDPPRLMSAAEHKLVEAALIKGEIPMPPAALGDSNQYEDEEVPF